jgi:hypothetical protein
MGFEEDGFDPFGDDFGAFDSKKPSKNDVN